MLEGGELTPVGWVVPISEIQLGMLYLGERSEVLTVEEVIEWSPAGNWGIADTTPRWNKEFVLKFI